MLISIECEARNGLMEREPLVERCFKCSVCAQVCPIQYLEEYSPTQSYVYDLFTCDNVLANPTSGHAPAVTSAPRYAPRM